MDNVQEKMFYHFNNTPSSKSFRFKLQTEGVWKQGADENIGLKRNEVTGGELHDLYYSPNITGMIKSRGIKWAGNVAGMGEMRNVSKFWLESLRGRDQSEDLGVGWRIILKCILRK
jgi:hypothetical protein